MSRKTDIDYIEKGLQSDSEMVARADGRVALQRLKRSTLEVKDLGSRKILVTGHRDPSLNGVYIRLTANTDSPG